MKFIPESFFLLLIYLTETVNCTCVLESDFGFTINCNFKKSGLFRIRNLGGFKAYFGIGLAAGDELGFPESLSNEASRKRALNLATNVRPDEKTIKPPIIQSFPQAVVSTQQMNQLINSQSFLSRNLNEPMSGVPKFKPIPQEALLETKTTEIPPIDLKGHTMEELAEFANVSVDVIKNAIKMRASQQTAELKTRQVTKKRLDVDDGQKNKISMRVSSKKQKVLNAPKEYYPVGYDKNFDDNFKSKVDLPATSFHCGDQKHFPGLYADQDLSCMVFHVCALTDEGLVMKSFLCPESTLFDQTILKCNWWFYTDCKSSKSLYDSNLPVSKSYQLMKSLAFFNSNYKDQKINQESL